MLLLKSLYVIVVFVKLLAVVAAVKPGVKAVDLCNIGDTTVEEATSKIYNQKKEGKKIPEGQLEKEENEKEKKKQKKEKGEGEKIQEGQQEKEKTKSKSKKQKTKKNAKNPRGTVKEKENEKE